MMDTRALLCVSFGTSWDDTREKTIGAVERSLAEAFPELPVRSAYTSGMVRRALLQRGIEIPGVSEALERLLRAGTRELLCQPTHLIYGEEYDKLLAEIRLRESAFDRVAVGRPLLGSYDDIGRVLAAVSAGIGRAPDEALVLMGHGTRHFCNTVYAAMDYYARRGGFRDVVIGTVEAWPDFSAALAEVTARGYRRAVLTPLMLVAGDHAHNDMTGGAESWLGRFRAAGVEARAVSRGLGEYQAVRALYCAHAQEAWNGV